MLHDPPAVISHTSATFGQEVLGPYHKLFQAEVHIKKFTSLMFPSNENGKNSTRVFVNIMTLQGNTRLAIKKSINNHFLSYSFSSIIHNHLNIIKVPHTVS
jgi:hypothetical protein